jgi:hypothetical protein
VTGPSQTAWHGFSRLPASFGPTGIGGDIVAVVIPICCSPSCTGRQPHLDMSGADLFGLIVGLAVCAYLVYALLRERL